VSLLVEQQAQEMDMVRLERVMQNILVKDLATSRDFYVALAGFEVIHDSDWYVVLTPPGQPMTQIGLIDQVSEFAPRHAWGGQEGTYMTLVVDDVFAALERARLLDVEIISEPVALAYGQTRALIRDPNGMVIDLSTPTEALASRERIITTGARDNAIDQQQPDDRETAPLRT
jgi:catechol 2,3-dioxygenase-like lactoylglutathione lyase family enzyme